MRNSIRSSIRSRHRPGLTLVEVVAGLALMATLLVSVLVIKARLTHSMAAAEARSRAVTAANAMLTDWWATPATFPVGRSGVVPGYPGLNWQTRVVPNPAAERLVSRIVRLDIAAAEPTTPTPAALTSVDVLLPLEPPHAP